MALLVEIMTVTIYKYIFVYHGDVGDKHDSHGKK
jgi:hypothetical protein